MAQDTFRPGIEACDNCADACLEERDAAPMARCIALDIDCAAVCRLAAATMARGSEFGPRFRAMCARICEACGQECAPQEQADCPHGAGPGRACAQERRTMAA